MRKSTLNRMLELADIKPVIKESKMNLSNFELVKESVDGNTYAIVRENKKYHIKETQTKEILTESDFDYVGGVANKIKKSFNSFSDATRELNFMFEEINNRYDVGYTDILESSDLLLEKKFVLKLDKKKSTKKVPDEEPIEEPSSEEGDVEFDFGGETEEGDEEFDFGGETEEPASEEGGEEFDFGGETEEPPSEESDVEFDDSEDEIKDIQSTTGKLGQQLRDVEDITSDMQKWVAKSVLSALDLDTMDSEDKKDIIRTVKKKSEESEDDTDEFDFEEDGVEETYDNYMNDDMDGMDNYGWDGSTEELEMKDIDMPIKDKGYLNIDPEMIANPYDSYMKEPFNEKAFNDWIEEMESLGIVSKDSKYDSHMEDIVGRDTPNDEYSPNRKAWESREDTELGGDENIDVADPKAKNVDDKLLLDIEEDMGAEEIEALYGPNSTRKYDRSGMSKAKRQADKDISKHYHEPAAPGYDSNPIEKWAKHKLPYDTEFMEEGDYMSEDHLNDQMETYEQEKAYEDVETLVRRYGMGVELREKATSEDPEESLIYLDIINDDKKLLVARINSVGDIEVGEMRGNKFTGEPLDSVEDFIEILGEDLTSNEKQELDMAKDTEMSPQPQRST